MSKKQLYKNFLALLVLQGSNYIIPLITLPYIIRTLGPDKFGLIAFAQAFIQYFIIITDFGFDLSATRQISINRHDKQKVSKIFTSVLIIKISLFALGLLIFLPLIHYMPDFSAEKELLMWFYLSVLAQALFPIWLFQGLETMKYITYLNIISKVIFNSLILLFIKSEAEYILYPVLQSTTSLAASVLGIIIVIGSLQVRFSKVSKADLIIQIKEGWYIFISNVTISLYTVSSAFVLGLFFNNRIVGYYSSAERVVKAFQGLLSPVTQAIYPHVSNLFNTSRKDAIIFLRKATLLVGVFTFTLSAGLFFASDLIVDYLFKDAYEESKLVLRILAWVPFIVAMSNIFGIQTMLNLKYRKQFFRILLICSAIHLAIVVVLGYNFMHIGVATSVLFTEALIAIMMYRFLVTKRIYLIKL
ncbi:flippase [Pontibacter sp. FD36]|nr:flippase [Pontibacter sp. FD36]